MTTVIVPVVVNSKPSQVTATARFETKGGVVNVEVTSPTQSEADAILEDIRDKTGYKEVDTEDSNLAFYIFAPPTISLVVGFMAWFIVLIGAGILDSAGWVQTDFDFRDALAAQAALIGGGFTFVGIITLFIIDAIVDAFKKKTV